MPLLNYLVIQNRAKGIPYGAYERDDGSRNNGFVPLKANPAAIASLSECQEDPPLRILLESANGADTAVFTVGCASGIVADEKGFRRSGYVEFALNDREAVGRAVNYFPAFFNFDQLWKAQGARFRMQFEWELQPATFLDCGARGFTCAVTLNTDYYASLDEADECWSFALELLSQLLESIAPKPDAIAIYATGIPES